MIKRAKMTVVVLASLCGLAASRAHAADSIDPTAKAHYERGVRHIQVQEYAQAIIELKAGFSIDPRPEFLFSLGQAQRMSHDCTSAIESYKGFLRSDPPKRAAFAARANLERCTTEVRLAQEKAARAAEDARVLENERRQAERDRAQAEIARIRAMRPRPVPWYKDALGGGLSAGGIALLAIGGGLVGGGNSRVASANAAVDYDTFAARNESAQTGQRMQTAGVVCLGIGGALAIGGIVRYVIQHRRTTLHSSKQ